MSVRAAKHVEPARIPARGGVRHKIIWRVRTGDRNSSKVGSTGIHIRTGAWTGSNFPGNFGRTRLLTKIEFSTSSPILTIGDVSYRIKRDRDI